MQFCCQFSFYFYSTWPFEMDLGKIRETRHPLIKSGIKYKWEEQGYASDDQKHLYKSDIWWSTNTCTNQTSDGPQIPVQIRHLMIHKHLYKSDIRWSTNTCIHQTSDDQQTPVQIRHLMIQKIRHDDSETPLQIRHQMIKKHLYKSDIWWT